MLLDEVVNGKFVGKSTWIHDLHTVRKDVNLHGDVRIVVPMDDSINDNLANRLFGYFKFLLGSSGFLSVPDGAVKAGEHKISCGVGLLEECISKDMLARDRACNCGAMIMRALHHSRSLLMNDASLSRAWANSRWTLLMKIYIRPMFTLPVSTESLARLCPIPTLRVLHAANHIQNYS